MKRLDWMTGIQHAIDYIEENLTEDLDYNQIAQKAYTSSYHFQRIFSLLCGRSLGEYIRERRLTLAGEELAYSEIKVIDAAIKYGYDTPESFSRAFARFHGITPSKAKLCGASLKSFSKLTVKLILEGGSIMDYKIEKKSAFKIIEKVRLFSTNEEISSKEIPAFWGEARQDGTIPTLCGFCGGTDFDGAILGICYGDGMCYSDMDSNTKFPYSIASGYNPAFGKPIPDGFSVREIPENTWAIFKCTGPMPGTIQELWKKIYTEFFPSSDYIPKNQIDFESYPDGDIHSSDYTCEIWIAVEKKA